MEKRAEGPPRGGDERPRRGSRDRWGARRRSFRRRGGRKTVVLVVAVKEVGGIKREKKTAAAHNRLPENINGSRGDAWL